MLTHQKCNIIENLDLDIQKEIRRLVIESVLNNDQSKHFGLLTELKTKLGNNFPSDSIEDRSLILTISLKVADGFKVIRERGVFFKWMENMSAETYRRPWIGGGWPFVSAATRNLSSLDLVSRAM